MAEEISKSLQETEKVIKETRDLIKKQSKAVADQKTLVKLAVSKGDENTKELAQEFSALVKTLQKSQEVLEDLEASSTNRNLKFSEIVSSMDKAEVEDRIQRKAYLENSRKDLDHQRILIEQQGGIATANKEYARADRELRQQEFDLQKDNATTKAGRKEIRQEELAYNKKHGTFMQKIVANTAGMWGSMKDKMKSAGKGVLAFLGSIAFGAVLLALGKFLQSPMFTEWLKYLNKTIIPMAKKFGVTWTKLGIGLGAIAAIFAWKKFMPSFGIMKAAGRLLASNLSKLGGKMKDKFAGMFGGKKGGGGPARDPKTGRFVKRGSPTSSRAGGRRRGPGVMSKIGQGAKSLGTGVGAGIGGLLKGMAGGLAALANPATLIGLAAIVLAINGIAFAIRIMSPVLEPFGKLLESTGEAIKTVFSGLGGFIKDIGKTIEGIISTIGDSIGKVIDKITSMQTAGTKATTDQIKELSNIPGDQMIKTASGIEAMKKALDDFGGGTFTKIGNKLFGGNGPIDKIIALSDKVPQMQKAARAIAILSAAGGDYMKAEDEIKRMKRIAQLEKDIASGDVEGLNTKKNITKAKTELATLKKQGQSVPASANIGGSIGISVATEHTITRAIDKSKILQEAAMGTSIVNNAPTTNNTYNQTTGSSVPMTAPKRAAGTRVN